MRPRPRRKATGGPGTAPAADAGMTQAERRAAERRAQHQRTRRIIRIGQLVMAAAVIVAVVHLLGHAGAFGGQPAAVTDLVAGYPAAGVLFLMGAIAAGR